MQVLKIKNYEAFLRKCLTETYLLKDVRCVWFCKTLQNAKGLYIDLETYNYYEVTFNGNSNEVYIDTYEKKSNESIHIDMID